MHVLIFPHQLYEQHPGLVLNPTKVVLLEDSLFFGDEHYPLRFHKQKLWLHRATMKRYENWLQERGFATVYFDYDPKPNSLRSQLERLCRNKKSRPSMFVVADPTDFILDKRLKRNCQRLGIELKQLSTPGFINHPSENFEFRSATHRWFMADFYKWQRQRLNILMHAGKPLGGKWSFDEQNRKKIPQKLLGEIPPLLKIKHDACDEKARDYVEKNFPNNPGSLDDLYYPTTHLHSAQWLQHFLKHRFEKFGDYEDAIIAGESWLWHSVLTPILNTGLLTPIQVVRETLAFSEENDVPINSLEGFIRQVIGWREFVRVTYQDLGVTMRTANHWNHNRSIPVSFYDGTTGVLPVDDTIRRVLRTGYCHHIERLMVLGGFMFLCEFHPDEIYNWFMEMFVDSYDWVMVPNVYAMSQHADGGAITTKPYFSGSSYVRKMSHYKKSEWCETWDGLYWRWIWKHANELAKNSRWAMMCSMVKKMDPTKRKQHLNIGDAYLSKLDDQLKSVN